MNQDQIAGQWKQLKGKVKAQWGKLTDDDLTRIEGKQEELVGRVQERYGIEREEAEKQVKDFYNRH
ncbi:MAG: CsbD family protein [Dongiaceae bacterium]